MAGRVIRGYWDCPQCGTKGIDGLKDECPNCGAGKDKSVRFYMKSVEEVSEEELTEAGISKDENDGKHRQWLCAYCGYLNKYGDETCVRCGASKEEKEQDYGGDTAKIQYKRDKNGKLYRVGSDGAAGSAQETGGTARPDGTGVSSGAQETAGFTSAASSGDDRSRKSGSPLRFVLLAGILALIAFLLWPHTTSEAITGFEWQRSVTVEELQTFQESDWSLPSAARLKNQKVELYGYRQVIDHYETVYEERSREVIDHYDTSYEYTDNGNGTFSEHEVQTPVYRTEYYEEPVQQPVYRNEPVYQTKYYYEIDRWVPLQTYDTSGSDHDPYWSNAYTLGNNQRDTDRSETYYTIYNETDRERVSYDTWSRQNIGDGIYVTRNRMGMEYSRKEQ